MSNLDSLKRPARNKKQKTLFDVTYDWEEHWWDMPEFNMGDATPQHKIVVNFMTIDDLLDFAKKLGIKVTGSSDTMWYPPQKLDEPKEWEYVED